ncbi:MAG: hypothetical protein DRN95_00025 [Candidatus Hydrothermarchaeota archaeon]|nr:MAG: hypothetical protein DRN95_00025 [Candidatus Hydrothermarchaeota archaeon]
MKNLEKGLSLAIEAIMDELENTYGRDRAKEIVYKAGYNLGMKEGKKLKDKAHTPENAVNILLDSIFSFYETSVAEVIKREKGVEIAIRVKKCAFRRVLEDLGCTTPGVICRFMMGFIEGALNTMTGMKTKHRVYTSSISNMCVGSISLSKK